MGVSSKVWYAGGDEITHSKLEVPSVFFRYKFLSKSQGKFVHTFFEVKAEKTK